MTKSIEKAIKGDVFIKGNRGDKVGSWENADNIMIDGVKLIDILLEVRDLKETVKEQQKKISKNELLIKSQNKQLKDVKNEVKLFNQRLENTVKELLGR